MSKTLRKEFEEVLEGYVEYTIEGEDVQVPIFNIPLMSDYKWHVDCLERRLKYPCLYQEYEDVTEKIAQLSDTVLRLTTIREYMEFKEKYPLAYKFIGWNLKEDDKQEDIAI